MRYTTQFLLLAMAAEQFPAPSVEEIAGLPTISVAHYGQQNGDAMRGPEMLFEVRRERNEIALDPTTTYVELNIKEMES
jgi:hypothetical protein